MIALLVAVLIALVVAYCCIVLIDMIGLPGAINMVAKAIVVLVAILFIAQRAGVANLL